jgi:hypothetical protein
MSQATAAASRKSSARQNASQRHRGKIVLIFVVAGCLLGAILFILCWRAFGRAAVLQDLQQASDSQVAVQNFHQTYFPFPGCVLEGLIFRHGASQNKPLITIEKLTIQGSYLGLLSMRLSRVTADGLRVSIPAFGTGEAFRTKPSKITIGVLVANGAGLEFAAHDADKQPLRFDIHEAFLRNVGPGGPFSYRFKVHNPEPPGEISVEGKFGAWRLGDAGETPISGEYTFGQADLSVYKGIAGTLSSTGKFSGALAHIDISGTTDTPDFEVKSGKHPVRLTTEFTAYVDATRGDTFLKHVGVNFWSTHIDAEGKVAGSPDSKGKTGLIDLKAANARIEDLLRLFVSDDRPAMSGSVSMQAHTEIPPGEEKFLKKLELRGSFGLAAGKFSKPSTQQGIDHLSAGARGQKQKQEQKDDPQTVLTDLTGQVDLRRGVAQFSDLSFGVPGVSAQMSGTFNLINGKVDLHGPLQVDSKISNAENGPKALLLKAIEPLFKKKKKGEIIPVRISGTYRHPSFGLDFDDKKAHKAQLPAFSPPK